MYGAGRDVYNVHTIRELDRRLRRVYAVQYSPISNI